jgi:hypothetical protein
MGDECLHFGSESVIENDKLGRGATAELPRCASVFGISHRAVLRPSRVDSGPYWQDREARLGVRVGEPHKGPFC